MTEIKSEHLNDLRKALKETGFGVEPSESGGFLILQVAMHMATLCFKLQEKSEHLKRMKSDIENALGYKVNVGLHETWIEKVTSAIASLKNLAEEEGS